MTSLREFRGDVRVPEIGIVTCRQVELLTSLSMTVWRKPKPGTKSGTVLSLDARGLLRMRLPDKGWLCGFGYYDLDCILTARGVEAVKAIRKVQRQRRAT